MQKIRKILRAISEKTALPTNQPTNQSIITSNTDLIGPRWRRSKKLSSLVKRIIQIPIVKTVTTLFIYSCINSCLHSCVFERTNKI